MRTYLGSLRLTLVVFVLLAASLSLVSCTGQEPEFVPPPAPSVTYFQAGHDPVALAFDGQNIWVANQGDATVTLLRPDGGIIGVFPVVDSPVAITYGGGYMWVASAGGRITQLTLSGQNIGGLDTGNQVSDILFWEDNLWLTNSLADSVSRISTNLKDIVIIPAGDNPQRLAVFQGNLWVTCQGDSRLVGIGADGQVQAEYFLYSSPSPIPSAEGNDGPSAVAVAGDKIWLAYPKSGVLVPVGAGGVRDGFYSLAGEPGSMVYLGDSLWVTDKLSGTVTRTKADGFVLGTYPIGQSPVALITDGLSLWAVDAEADKIIRIEP